MKFVLPIDKYLQNDHQLSMRVCDHEGCSAEGSYRAPKNRHQLREYYWFCLMHVRDYNAKWNYYAGMNTHEIETDQTNASKWERPTWPFGQLNKQNFTFHHHADPLEILGKDLEYQRQNFWFAATSPEGKALRILDLSWPLSYEELKKRYKELVKKYHPDINQKDPQATEIFKKINEAYGVLKKALGV